MFNKRGISDTGKIILAIAIVIGILVLGSIFFNTEIWDKINKNLSIDTNVDGFDTKFGKTFGWMTYVFGGIPTWLKGLVGENSAIVITLFTWLLLFVTFGDIFAAFSTFSKPASWVIAFAMAVIFANLKVLVIILGFFIGIFAFVGGFAVIVGLLTAFIVFIGVNWGIGSIGPFIIRRKMLLLAARHAAESEAGGAEISGTIEGLEKIGEALKKATKKKGK